MLCPDQLSEVSHSTQSVSRHDLLCLGSDSWLLEAPSILEKGLLKQGLDLPSASQTSVAHRGAWVHRRSTMEETVCTGAVLPAQTLGPENFNLRGFCPTADHKV